MKLTLAIFLFSFLSCTDQALKSDLDIDTANGSTEFRKIYCEWTPCDPLKLPISKTYVINGCSITVSYILLKCPNWIAVKNFSYSIAQSAPCRDVKQVWNQYYFVGQSLEANLALNNFYRALTLLVQADILASLTPSNYPNGFLNAVWIETKCHVMCVEEIKFDDLPSYFDVSYSVCGIKCCHRNTKYILKDGVLVQDGPSTITDLYPVFPCEPLPIQCKEGSTRWGNTCEPVCARL